MKRCFVFIFYFNKSFLIIECVNVLKHLEGRFINILFIKSASHFQFTDFQLIVGGKKLSTEMVLLDIDDYQF